ncbi:hypothetical protein BDB01DRAFT_852809 [Pilobolus umbonatus]|nr:hypothetical protein BDB01DRAFT_852809 [Pilobolus umbonatus]
MVSAYDKGFNQRFFTPSRGIHININTDPFQHRIQPYLQQLWQESRGHYYLSVSKRRLIRRYHRSTWIEFGVLGLGVVSCCLLLLVHVGFFSGKKYQDWQQEHTVLEEIDLLAHVYPDEGRSQTTAIVLVSHREQDIEGVIRELCPLDMFATVVIWNDNTSFTVPEMHIDGCSPKRLVVVNAPVTMGLGARYHACKTSKTPYCYFQDQPLGYTYLRSTYANFLKSPYLIHSQATHHQAYIDSQFRYCFSNEEVDLHACYMSMGTGTFIAKEMVSQFMDHYDQSAVVDDYADIYFSIFINEKPYLLDGNGVTYSPPDSKSLEHISIGLNVLFQDLLLDEQVVKITPYIESTSIDRNARSSCADDRCLFLTNKDILPKMEYFLYLPPLDVDEHTLIHDEYVHQYPPHSYSYAVDRNESTSWESIDNIHAGDYIGLDLLMPMRNSLKYRFVVRHPYVYRTSLNYQISYDGSLWVNIIYITPVDTR